MTRNLTSERIEDILNSAESYYTQTTMKAIAQKYKRYEETLKTIRDCPDHKDGLCESCRKIIKMELKFDPLPPSGL